MKDYCVEHLINDQYAIMWGNGKTIYSPTNHKH